MAFYFSVANPGRRGEDVGARGDVEGGLVIVVGVINEHPLAGGVHNEVKNLVGGPCPRPAFVDSQEILPGTPQSWTEKGEVFWCFPLLKAKPAHWAGSGDGVFDVSVAHEVAESREPLEQHSQFHATCSQKLLCFLWVLLGEPGLGSAMSRDGLPLLVPFLDG